MASLGQIPRSVKRTIAGAILGALVARAKKGPKEAAIDAFIPELEALDAALGESVDGSATADAQRAARLLRLEEADDLVDTLYRHILGYVDVEARRRTGPNAARAKATYDAAFSDGLAHVDDVPADENRYCRDRLTILAEPEHAATLEAIELPGKWLTAWAMAIDASDAVVAELEQARRDGKTHKVTGREAEAEWVEVMARLRSYIGARAKKTDKERIAEGRNLIAPLLAALAKQRTDAAARATRRKNRKDAEPPAPADPAKKDG
jgi:hypothetical protein